jgi:hypothetical protein
VGAGLECGVGVNAYNDWQEGDIIFAFNKVAKRRTLEDASVTVTAAVAANSNRQWCTTGEGFWTDFKSE